MTPAPWFGRKAKAARNTARQSVDALPDGLWTKCPQCGEILFNKELEKNLRVCNKCGSHYKLSAAERLEILIDDGTFEEMDANLTTVNVLQIPEYDEKMAKWRTKTGLDDAIITGTGDIDGRKVVLGVLDFYFWAGTMGGGGWREGGARDGVCHRSEAARDYVHRIRRNPRDRGSAWAYADGEDRGSVREAA